MLSRGPSHGLDIAEEKLIIALAKLCERRGVHITVQWIPSHCGNVENDRVDAMARTAVVDQPREVDYRVMKQVIKLMVRKEWDAETSLERGGVDKDHVWTRATSGRVPRFPVDTSLPRREQRLLAQLRAGKSIVLGVYKRTWAKQMGAETCEKCGAADDITHFLECPFHANERKVWFGTACPGPEVLYKHQGAVVEYAVTIGIWCKKISRTARHQVAVVLCCFAASVIIRALEVSR